MKVQTISSKMVSCFPYNLASSTLAFQFRRSCPCLFWMCLGLDWGIYLKPRSWPAAGID